MLEIRNTPIIEKTYGVKARAKQKGHLPCISLTPVWSSAPQMVLECLPGTECRAMNLQEHYQKSQYYKTRATRHMCNSPLSLRPDPQGKKEMHSLTWLMGSFVGGFPLLAVLVARVVVVSIIEVDISDCMAVAVDSVVIEEGTSPTSLTLPTMMMLASFSAAIFRTFKPL